MAYDRDGTVVARVRLDTATITPLTVGEVANLNRETGTYVFTNSDAGSWRIAFVFPELRDVVAITAGKSPTSGVQQPVPGLLVKSTDTTNGFDGTWTTVLNPWTATANSDETMRTDIQTAVASGIKGLGFNITPGAGFNNRHIGPIQIFGSITAGQNPNRLRFWQTAVDAEIAPAHFDLGDVQQGTQQTVAFRIKNNSATLTAQSIGISTEALSDTVPSNVGQHEFSTDGVVFTPTINIGNLGPGFISPVLYMRRTTSPTAALSLWWVRFVASAAAWV